MIHQFCTVSGFAETCFRTLSITPFFLSVTLHSHTFCGKKSETLITPVDTCQSDEIYYLLLIN